MSQPAPRIPRYSRAERWRPETGDERRSPDGPSDDAALRAASVIPFILVAAFALIALVGWVVVIVLGVALPGGPHTQPVWRAIEGEHAGRAVSQLALIVGIGLIPLAVLLAAGWATAHGFRARPHRLFWPTAAALWVVVAVALVAVELARPRFTHDVLGLGTIDWWFVFALVVAAAALAVVRVRRLRVRPDA